MKKFLFLFLLTAIVVIGVCSLPIIFGAHSKKVMDVITVVPSTVQSTVIATGRVEYAESVDIDSKNTAIVKKSYIQPGEQVNKGDKLYSLSEAVMNYFPSSEDLGNFHSVNDVFSVIKSRENYFETGKNIDIFAPKAGTIACVFCREGDVIMPNTSFCSVVNSEKFIIKASINESQISEIKTGQVVYITGTGFEGECKGHIQNISKEAKQISGMSGQETIINTSIALDEYPPSLKHGFTVKCKIITDENEDIVILPYEAINSENGEQYVYKVSDDSKLEKVFVTTGKEYENGIEILSGICADDTIVEKGDIENVN